MSGTLQRTYGGAQRPSQRAAGYVGGGGRERCAECRFFMPASTCMRIQGPVTARGWCRYYSRELSVLRYSPRGASAGGGLGGGWTLDLGFTAGVLDPSLTFTRASTGTYFDSSGVMRTAAMNTVYPSVVGPGSWTVIGAATMGGSVVAPDGSVSTTSLVAASNTTNAIHLTGTNNNPPVAATTAYVVSMYMKAGPVNGCLQLSCGSAVGTAYFDLTNGTGVVGADLAGGLTNKSVTIAPAPNGWYRVSYAFTTQVGATSVIIYVGPCITVSGTGDNRSYVGVVGQGAYVWGVQMELGSVATPYIPTTTAPNGAPRFDYDPVTHAALGLLIEEQRTNIVTNSGTLTDFTPSGTSKTAAATTAPDGTLTGVRVTEDSTASAEHVATYGFTPTANAVYTLSAYVKANTRSRVAIEFRVAGNWVGGNVVAIANLTAGTIAVTVGTATAAIQNAGGGWYRIMATATAVAAPAGSSQVWIALCDNTGNNIYTGDGASNAYFWGAQVEAGAFPTSYIPTTAAAVTRSADQCSIQPAQMGFYTPPGGSWQLEFIDNHFPGAAAYQRVISRYPGPSNWSPVLVENVAAPRVGQYDTTLQFSGNTMIASSVTKIATTVAGTVGQACLNGGAVASGPVTGGYANLGATGVGLLNFAGATAVEAVTGYIRRVRYWPRVLTNAELQAVTA